MRKKRNTLAMTLRNARVAIPLATVMGFGVVASALMLAADFSDNDGPALSGDKPAPEVKAAPECKPSPELNRSPEAKPADSPAEGRGRGPSPDFRRPGGAGDRNGSGDRNGVGAGRRPALGDRIRPAGEANGEGRPRRPPGPPPEAGPPPREAGPRPEPAPPREPGPPREGRRPRDGEAGESKDGNSENSPGPRGRHDRLASHRGPGDGGPPLDRRELFKAIDANGDGVLSLDEFMAHKPGPRPRPE